MFAQVYEWCVCTGVIVLFFTGVMSVNVCTGL